MSQCQLCEVAKVIERAKSPIWRFLGWLLLAVICGLMTFGGIKGMVEPGTDVGMVSAASVFGILTLLELWAIAKLFRYIFIGAYVCAYSIRGDSVIHFHRMQPPADVVGSNAILRLREGGVFLGPRVEYQDGTLLREITIRQDWRTMWRITLEVGSRSMTVPLNEAIEHLSLYRGGLEALMHARQVAAEQRDQLVIGLAGIELDIDASRARSKSPHAASIRDQIGTLLRGLPEQSVARCRQIAKDRRGAVITEVAG